ncbi:MAG: ABC transporter permease subunit [Coriobacteriaceae bacterium]|jgi:NitT/TauT family transport system permease protein|nr:ABC transporter permease subunit [Coriobacteriaceae bacterium]
MAELLKARRESNAHEKRERFIKPSFIVATVLFLLTLVAIYVPGPAMADFFRAITFGAIDQKGGNPPKAVIPFYVAVLIVWLLFMWRYIAGGRKRSTCNIASVVFLLFIVWEIASTDLKLTHPVLIPLPENVFNVFPKFQDELIRNVVSSMTMLLQGFLTSLIAATIIGLFVGWLPKVRETVFPIAKVLAPVPAIVFTPYLVMLLHSFRAAAIMVIFLGIFWPTLMNTILRVESLDKRILDSAKMMGLSTPTMIFRVLLPYLYPTIATGLKIQLPSAMLMLVMAEMYGASSGLGYFVINYTNYGEYTNVVAGIIMVGIVVTVLDALVGLLVKKTVKWSE